MAILERKNFIGYWYFHRFLKNGVEFDIETTKADYLQLGGKNPVNPTRVDSRWVCSFQSPKFDTPSGHIEEGTFCVIDEEGGNIIAKPKGKKACNPSVSDFSDISKGELKDNYINLLL